MQRLIRSVIVAALFLTGACGGGDDNNTSSSSAATGGTSGGTGDTSGGTQETTVPLNCANVEANVTINIVNESFQPDEIGVPVNGIVRWTNNDNVTHTVTSGEPGHSDAGALFDSGNLNPGATFCLQLNTDAAFDFFCRIHNEMQGEIKVGTARDNDDDENGDDGDDNNGDDRNRGGGNDDPDNPSNGNGSTGGNDANRGRT